MCVREREREREREEGRNALETHAYLSVGILAVEPDGEAEALLAGGEDAVEDAESPGRTRQRTRMLHSSLASAVRTGLDSARHILRKGLWSSLFFALRTQLHTYHRNIIIKENHIMFLFGMFHK